MRRALREKLMIYQDGDKITACIDLPIPVLPIDDLDAFFSVATSFGLEPELASGNQVMLRERTARQESVVGKRTSEYAMRIAALQVAAGKPHGKATMTELKNEVAQYVVLTPEDLLPSKTRPNEAMYQQIVGNIVSHRESRNNIFAKGWAIYTGDGIQITDAGRHHLRGLGL
jgi:hypothetical protein